MVTINALDKGKKAGSIFMDLSKAFNTFNHNFLLAKLNAHDFSFNAIFVQRYLSEQFQWCYKTLLGVPKPCSHLLVQSQQYKHQKKMWNMFKVNNKNYIFCVLKEA